MLGFRSARFSHTLVFSLRNPGHTRERVSFGVSDFVALRPTARNPVHPHPSADLSLYSRTCRAIRFNLKSFNQCIQAALNQNVRPSRYLVRAKQFHRLILHPSVSLRALLRYVSPVPLLPPSLEHPTVAHPRTSRNELIRQSDEGRATVCMYMYTYTYRYLTKRGVIPSRRFTITKET